MPLSSFSQIKVTLSKGSDAGLCECHLQTQTKKLRMLEVYYPFWLHTKQRIIANRRWLCHSPQRHWRKERQSAGGF